MADERALPLAQVAFILAAQAEGFALDDVLASEGVPADHWSRARASTIASVVADKERHRAFEAALETAQDRLMCSIEPLFDDLEAWLALCRACERRSFAEVALDHGLVANDLARLQRHWASRLDEDTKLRARALALRERHALELPPLEVGTRRLIRSGDARGAAVALTPEVESDVSGELQSLTTAFPELAEMAAFVAAVELGADEGAVWSAYGFVSREAAEQRRRRYREREETDPDFRGLFRTLVRHSQSRAQVMAQRGPAPDRATEDGPLGDAPLEETAAVVVVSREALPFTSGGTSSATPLSEHEREALQEGAGETAGIPVLRPEDIARVVEREARRRRTEVDLGGMTMRRFAGLEVDLSAEPTREVETLASYGIDSQRLEHLRRELGRRIREEPALAAQFDGYRAEYHAWRASRGR